MFGGGTVSHRRTCTVGQWYLHLCVALQDAGSLPLLNTSGSDGDDSSGKSSKFEQIY